MKRNYGIQIILVLALVVNLVGVASAGTIVGVSPGNAIFENVLRGGYSERFITVTIDSDEVVGIVTEARGEIESWLDYDRELNASRDNPGRILLSVSPPRDIPNGNYTGFLRVETGSVDSEIQEGHAASTVRAVLDVAIRVEITDHEILSCVAKDFEVSSTEKGDDIEFSMRVVNKGNVRINPKAQVDIWDQEQISIVKSGDHTGREILPTKEEKVEFTISSDDLELDQYWVDFSSPDCVGGATLTFDVLEPGALKAEGRLSRIIGWVWAKTGDTIPIIATFDNVGEKDVDSKFKGQITRDGKIVQVLESEEINVRRSESSNFTFFFTPKKSGKYIASGRVFYDKKRTFESSTVINVNPKGIAVRDLAMWLVYIIIAVVIGVLFRNIRKERRKYLDEFRKVKYGY